MTRTAIGTVCSDEQAEALNRELGIKMQGDEKQTTSQEPKKSPKSETIVADGICPNCGARLPAPTALVKGGSPGAMCRKCRRVWRVG